MKSHRGIGLLLVAALFGCNSSNSSSPEPAKSNPDGAPSVGDAKVAEGDLPAGASTNLPAGPPQTDAAAVTPQSDGPAAAQSDAIAIIPSPDLPPLSQPDAATPSPDTPIVPPQADAAPAADGSSLVSSTSTPDDSTDPVTCSTVVLDTQTFSANKTLDIVMPDCHRVSGTVTLADPLPTGAVYGNGQVEAVKLFRDGSGRITEATSYAADITAIDSTHYHYSVNLPSDTFEVQYIFTMKSGALIPSTATRIGQEQLTVGASGIKHDVTLPALDVQSLTVTVTGTDAIPSISSSLFGRFTELMLLNASHTLMTGGVSMSSAASLPITMWVPRGTIQPTLLVQESPGTSPPYPSGHVSQFRLDTVTPTSDFSLALPAIAKISGTVSDPSGALVPMSNLGTAAGTSAVSYYQCNSLDTGTYPNPMFFYPEGSASSFFSAATSHAFFVRTGLDCVAYANYAVAVGTASTLLTRAGENNYAFLEDPPARPTDVVTASGDLVRNLVVPALGAQVAITGTVKDARAKGIAGASIQVVSRTLTTASVANSAITGGVDVSADGSYVLHVLPGTYRVEIALPKAAATTPSNPDAGTTTNKDAGYVLPDISFSLPDLGTGGCSTLSPCCAGLTGTDKTMCDFAISSGMESSCSSILSMLRLGGKCQ